MSNSGFEWKPGWSKPNTCLISTSNFGNTLNFCVHFNKNKQVDIKTQCWLEVDLKPTPYHCWKRGLLVGNKMRVQISIDWKWLQLLPPKFPSCFSWWTIMFPLSQWSNCGLHLSPDFRKHRESAPYKLIQAKLICTVKTRREILLYSS